MGMLETPAVVETPPAGTPDPKAAAPANQATTAPVVSTKSDDRSGSKPSGSPAEDFDRRLEELAAADLAAKRAQRDADVKANKYSKYEPLEARIAKGEIVDAIKELVGDKWSPKLIIEMANAFPDVDENGEPVNAELSIEDRVKQAIADSKAAELKAAEDAKKLATEAASAEGEQMLSVHLKDASKFLRENVAKFPLIQRLDDHPLVDHVALYRQGVLDRITKGEWVTDPARASENIDAIYAGIEASHKALLDKANPQPVVDRAPGPDWDAIQREANERKVASRPAPDTRTIDPNRRRSGLEEAYANLEAAEAESRGRAALAFRR